MDNHKEYIVAVFTQCYPSVFDSTVLIIIDGQSEWIKKNFSGALKTHPVFPEVFYCLNRIPFKIILHSLLFCNLLLIYISSLMDAKDFTTRKIIEMIVERYGKK
jgi:hypothetical protein